MMLRLWAFLFISFTMIFGLYKNARAEDKAQPSVLEGLKFTPGDEEGNEKKALRAELLVSATEQRAIAQIQKLIKKYKNTQLEPDLDFRLAEMYMRKSKTDRFFEVHRESSTVVKLAPRLVECGRAAARV